ncbi:MAG: hypothetical protein LBG63_01660 [Candidatus Methanoplasma sp.]|jgi:hypothetical protein|nr:hypothetical protein [Candidatus Methanoplasma sp.]
MESSWYSVYEEETSLTFEEFIKKIEKEREEIISASKSIDDIMSRYSEILSDDLSSGLRHIYSDQSFFAEILFWHVYLKKQTEKRDILSELKRSENLLLLKNHIDSELSHSWYGTTSSQLMIVHSFKCNVETKQWLKNKKGFLDLGPFEDLAFYKGDECMMGSCTHERMIL